LFASASVSVKAETVLVCQCKSSDGASVCQCKSWDSASVSV